jgi:hypothetical protein
VSPQDNPDSVNYTFTSCNTSVASIPDGLHVEGSGFGVTTIMGNSNGIFGPTLELYVGSVIIAGADGNSWQIFSDGSSKLLSSDQISKRIQGLEGKNILFADVGNNNIYDATPNPKEPSEPKPETSATAVTCYLLNLQSVTRQS